MISFSNKKDNTLKEKKVSDFSYFALQTDTQRQVFFFIGINYSKFSYGVYIETDAGHKYFSAMNCEEDTTFFDVFGSNYNNVRILEEINVDMDCVINQDYG